jgi:hypothetical protein
MFNEKAELTRFAQCATDTCGVQSYTIHSPPRTLHPALHAELLSLATLGGGSAAAVFFPNAHGTAHVPNPAERAARLRDRSALHRTRLP